MTELYRHFDARGRLLYVGISTCTFVRFTQHRTRAQWFDDVVTVTIERYPTNAEAREAERMAIKNERPLFNIAIGKPVCIGGAKITRDELATVAQQAGTTLGYLADQVANGHRKPSPELAKKIAAASGGRVKLADLRPDLWGRAA